MLDDYHQNQQMKKGNWMDWMEFRREHYFLPTASHIKVLEMQRSIPIVDQITGKAFGGGVPADHNVCEGQPDFHWTKQGGAVARK